MTCMFCWSYTASEESSLPNYLLSATTNAYFLPNKCIYVFNRKRVLKTVVLSLYPVFSFKIFLNLRYRNRRDQ
uniref:Uncharacterized protein n=1 Tax=Ciona intestinalis TaxID=7719 RepID=H2Y2M9_CIOIN